MIKALIFDCFGVLTTERWHEFIGSLPEGVDVEAVRQAHRDYTAGKVSKQQCAERIQALAGRAFTEAEDLESGDLVKDTNLLAYIGELKARGYRLGILSNIGSDWIRKSLLTPEEQELFDDMVFSYEVGLIKPQPEIFRLCCERLKVEPAQAVLIDDIARYCEAAQAEGMQAVVYQDLKQAQTEIESLLKSA